MIRAAYLHELRVYPYSPMHIAHIDTAWLEGCWLEWRGSVYKPEPDVGVRYALFPITALSTRPMLMVNYSKMSTWKAESAFSCGGMETQGKGE